MGFEIRRNKNYIELLPSFNFIWEYATQATNTIELMKRESKSVKKRKKIIGKKKKTITKQSLFIFDYQNIYIIVQKMPKW